MDSNVVSCHERGLSHTMLISPVAAVCNDCGWEQHPVVTAALEYQRRVNEESNGRSWAELELGWISGRIYGLVDVGVIHTNGTKEIALKTRSFFFDTVENKVHYFDSPRR